MRSPLYLYGSAAVLAFVAAVNTAMASGPTRDGWFHLAIAAACLVLAGIRVSIANKRRETKEKS